MIIVRAVFFFQSDVFLSFHELFHHVRRRWKRRLTDRVEFLWSHRCSSRSPIRLFKIFFYKLDNLRKVGQKEKRKIVVDSERKFYYF
jgi:hypothetical protein